jgi:hypothetical protein
MRHAGGHWFEPSTAHSGKARSRGFSVSDSLLRSNGGPVVEKTKESSTRPEGQGSAKRPSIRAVLVKRTAAHGQARPTCVFRRELASTSLTLLSKAPCGTYVGFSSRGPTQLVPQSPSWNLVGYIAGASSAVARSVSKVPFSRAHLIPDSIGGFAWAWTKCKECNESVGSSIEHAVVNDDSIRFSIDVLWGQLPALAKKFDERTRWIARTKHGPIEARFRKGAFEILTTKERGRKSSAVSRRRAGRS